MISSYPSPSRSTTRSRQGVLSSRTSGVGTNRLNPGSRSANAGHTASTPSTATAGISPSTKPTGSRETSDSVATAAGNASRRVKSPAKAVTNLRRCDQVAMRLPLSTRLNARMADGTLRTKSCSGAMLDSGAGHQLRGSLSVHLDAIDLAGDEEERNSVNARQGGCLSGGRSIPSAVSVRLPHSSHHNRTYHATSETCALSGNNAGWPSR